MYPFPFILPQPWWRTFSFLDNYMSGNTGWETLLITTLQINPTQSSWLSDIWTMYMYPLSFFSTKALMENLFFAGQRDEWKRQSSGDNSADKSPSIKLVVRYIIQCIRFPFLDGEPFLFSRRQDERLSCDNSADKSHSIWTDPTCLMHASAFYFW